MCFFFFVELLTPGLCNFDQNLWPTNLLLKQTQEIEVFQQTKLGEPQMILSQILLYSDLVLAGFIAAINRGKHAGHYKPPHLTVVVVIIVDKYEHFVKGCRYIE